jgi:hypothetical protein
MEYKVEALEIYKKRGIIDSFLDRIPEPGEVFEVNKDRLNLLLGNNKYNEAFVKLVEEEKEIGMATKKVVPEKAVKKRKSK